MKTTCFRFSLVVVITILFGQFAIADTDTIGPNGINSAGLNGFNNQPLTGNGISIGQVEPGRPAKKNNPDTSPTVYNNFVNPFMVFDRAGLTNGNLGGGIAGPHAENVASVMVSTDNTVLPPDINGTHTFAPTGVSTAANLLSIAWHPATVTDNFQDQAAVSSQTIVSYAKSNPGLVDPIRATNMSFGIPLPGPNPTFDGNSTMTEYIDWSASNDNVLYVVGGNEFDDNNNELVGVPADNFNGMTIGRAAKGTDGKYDVVSAKNAYQTTLPADRTWISLIAPGDNIDLDTTGTTNYQVNGGGTSFAAPHVTGTVALLQQYGKQRQASPTLHWSSDYSQHQVMKAVLMNSADKVHLQSDLPATIAGLPSLTVPAGGFLDQDRTVLRKDLGNWFSDTAAADKTPDTGGLKPLDDQFGAGELDAKRALKQFSAGEFHSSEAGNPYNVPDIGWDFGHSQNQNQRNTYAFNQQLISQFVHHSVHYRPVLHSAIAERSPKT